MDEKGPLENSFSYLRPFNFHISMTTEELKDLKARVNALRGYL